MPKKIKVEKATAPTLPTRPPVVVILGHVDHGKTTLLDAIRKTEVADSEYGGITQSIGAYQIDVAGKKITFIDTPGHEAFTKMRSQGASVADIAVLVVAANDSVMPQTIESIKLIKEAKIPYIVAINKIDLPEANFDKVVKDLLRHDVQLEKYGGQIPFIKISAKKGDGIKELLDLIELLAEVNNITGDSNAPVAGQIIESRLDKNRGPVATVIVKNGTLRVGDIILNSKIRALTDFQGQQMREAGPGTPVEILGLASVPAVGTELAPTAVDQNPIPLQTSNQSSAESLNLILKADTLGSLAAITATIPPNVRLLSSATGEITEKDVLLAKSTKAIILGFNVKIASSAQKLVESERVLTRTYKIIYELLDELKDAAAGQLEPVLSEETLGVGKIIAEFPFEKLRIAGVRVEDGRLAKGDLVKVNDQQTRLKSLRVGKDEVTKVEKGRECGLLLDPQVDFKIGDSIISYRLT